MIRRRHLVLAIALLAATALLTSTSGFSAMSADRSVHVEVADDRSAYLGFELIQRNNVGNGTIHLNVNVTNQFPSRVDLATVEVTVDGTTVDLTEGTTLGPGESANHTFTAVSCSDTMSVVASGDGVSVHLERRVICGNPETGP